jgi:hypothetical protein
LNFDWRIEFHGCHPFGGVDQPHALHFSAQAFPSKRQDDGFSAIIRGNLCCPPLKAPPELKLATISVSGESVSALAE